MPATHDPHGAGEGNRANGNLIRFYQYLSIVLTDRTSSSFVVNLKYFENYGKVTEAVVQILILTNTYRRRTRARTHKRKHQHDDVLFIGTRFSNL